MGYSIYFHTTEAEDRLLQQVVTPWLNAILDRVAPETPAAAFGFPYVGVRYKGEDLGYCKQEHKGDRVFGLDYGSQETAYALLYTVGTALGKTRYWYDGDEETEFNQLWWRKPKEQWSKHHHLDYSEVWYRTLDAVLDNLTDLISNTPVLRTTP